MSKLCSNLEVLVISCRVDCSEKMQRRLYQKPSPADSVKAAFQAKPRGPSPPPLRSSLFRCLKQSWSFSEILLSGLSWKNEKKTLLSKRNKGWHLPLEFHVLRVLYMTGRFWRQGPAPDQKTNNCTKMSKTQVQVHVEFHEVGQNWKGNRLLVSTEADFIEKLQGLGCCAWSSLVRKNLGQAD